MVSLVSSWVGRISMGAIDHDVWLDVFGGKLLLTDLDAHGVIVGLSTSAPEDYMSIWISLRLHNRYFAVFVDPQKSVGASAGLKGVDGHIQAAICAVFEADRG